MAKKKKSQRARRTPSELKSGQVWLLAPNVLMEVTSCTLDNAVIKVSSKSDKIPITFSVNAYSFKRLMSIMNSKYKPSNK
jgi:hypothetical protein